ncbi:MAG: VWA domain-containing protein [Deltaproteobacteria bacterium]|nr:VWA domain-containing protein [Deltaproteobacteria bacterium]
MKLRRLLSSTVLAAAGAIAACSDTRDGFDDSPPPSPPITNGEGGVPTEGGNVCLSEQVKAEAVPLAMLVLVDRSGSMLGDKWEAATKALRAFADRSEVVGMKMGVQFFPPLAAGDECNGSLYKNLAVPIASLPENVVAIQSRLLATQANGGGTPMRSGLEGSIGAMRDFLEANPLHEGVVILVTDGDPTSCGAVSAVVGAASGGAKPPSGVRAVRTFAVGMDGATFGNLDQIASAGGGFPTAFNVGGGAAAQTALVDALEKVRTGALGCEYVLPLPPPEKGILDLDSVVVELTPGQNDPKTAIRRVPDKAACGATTGGYYYDDPKTPTRVVLCPASCDAVRGAAASAKVDLAFGCIQRPN